MSIASSAGLFLDAAGWVANQRDERDTPEWRSGNLVTQTCRLFTPSRLSATAPSEKHLDRASVDFTGQPHIVRERDEPERSLTTAAPTRLTLDGPLLRALNNTTIDVTSLALGSACCSAFDVEQAASSSARHDGPDPALELMITTVRRAVGGTLVFVADAGGVADGPIAASRPWCRSGDLCSAA